MCEVWKIFYADMEGQIYFNELNSNGVLSAKICRELKAMQASCTDSSLR
jgi:hypothetical protein